MKPTNTAWKAIVQQGENANINRSVYVLKQHYPIWDQIKQEHPGNYYKTSLVRAVYSLAITPGGRQKSLQPLNLEGAQVNYKVDGSGDVLIYGLKIDSSISAPVADQTTGLYRVDREFEEWNTQPHAQISMEHTHHWNNAHYAAVSGNFDNKEEAGRLLITHIIPAYKAALKPKDVTTGKKHYSLFWQNGKHQTETNSKSLAALIQQVQANDARINWLVHGEGAGTFVKALQSITSTPGIGSMVAKQNDLSNQSAFFSNPRGTNTRKEELEKLCKAAGIDLVDVNINSRDMKNADARQAAWDESVKLLAKYGIGGAAGATGWTTLEKAINLGGATSTTLAAIGFGVAGYVVAKDAITKNGGYARNVKNVAGNTWGSGNKQWAA